MVAWQYVPRIRFSDAQRIKQALNTAAMEPVPGERARMLTPQELHELRALVDSVTIQPESCSHSSRPSQMVRCPNCGRRSPT